MATSSMPMFDPSGKLRWIPNDQLDAAAKGGGQAAVRIVDPQGIERWIPKSVAHEAIAAGARFVSPEATEQAIQRRNSQNQPLPQGAVSRLLSSAASPIAGALSGMANLVHVGPTEEEKKNLKTPLDEFILYPRRVYNATVAPILEQGREAGTDLSQGRYAEAAGHELAATTPIVGPLAAQAGERLGKQFGSGNYAGGIGTILGNAALLVAPKVGAKALEVGTRIPEAVRSTLKDTAGISPVDLRKAARDTVDANEEATRKHLNDTAEALHETQGREAERLQSLRRKTEEIADKDAAEAEKSRREYEKKLQDVKEHNERVKAKHDSVKKRIEEENDALQQTMEHRNRLAEDLATATADHYALEDRIEEDARQKANEPWNRWHAKMDKVPVEQNEVFEDLKKTGVLTPQVEEQLKFIEPNARLAEPASKYALTRSSIMENMGERRPYDELSPYKQEMYDKLTNESGVHPETIDLSPDSPATTIGKLHQARSTIEERIRAAGGRGEHFDVGGVSVGRLKVVSRVLGDIIDKYTKQHGMSDDLAEGRAATRTFKEAFGRAAPKIRTQAGIREAWINPESDAARAIEDNLDKSEKVDPRLAASAKRIRAMRDELKKLPTEDQLRKRLKQVPSSPMINDVREGYRLQEEPKAPPLRLTSGSVGERAEQSVPLNERVEFPDRPVEKNISPETLKAMHKEAILEKGARLSHSTKGKIGSLLAGGGISTWGMAEALRGSPEYGAALIAAGTLVGVGQRALGALLSNPEIADWVAEPTAKEIDVVRKMSPDQQAAFGENLKPLLEQAKRKGMKVDPRWIKIASGTAIAASTYAHTAKNAQGHTIGSNDGVNWFDTQTGAPVNAQ